MKLYINNQHIKRAQQVLIPARKLLVSGGPTPNLTLVTGNSDECALQYVKSLVNPIDTQLTEKARCNAIEASLPVLQSTNGFNSGRNIPFAEGSQHFIRLENGITFMMGWSSAQQVTYTRSFLSNPFMCYVGHNNGTNNPFNQNVITPNIPQSTTAGFSWLMQPSTAGSQRRQWLAIGRT
jgi:hypothetical protein